MTATAGTPAASYTTVSGAFGAINAGTHQGAITLAISGDTTETVSAALNASGAGAAIYTSVVISPSGGAARTISGAIAAGSPLIDLNGADNVTIDGLNTGGNSLTIANTTVSATSGTSTIRFIGGATNNVITNTNVQGSGTSSVATNGATIFFSTDAVTVSGNDNNTISNNNIGPAGANLPSKAILCNGTTTTTAIGNSGNIVNNNNIFDFFAPAVTSSGIASNGGCNTWTISNNRLYQTAARTWTTGALHVGIDIRPTTATSGAQGFTITGNTVGFASNTQTGTYALSGTGTGAKFIGILFNGIVAGATTNVNNNTVAGVSMTGVTGAGTTTASPFTGILLQEGNIISNGNTIGSQAGTGSLTFSTTTTSATDVYGIHNFTSNAWTSNNNSVGGISATNLGASGTFLLIGIRAFTGTTVTWNASGNTVGGTVPNSLQLTANGVGSQVLGMFTSNAPAVLSGNTVRNLTTNIGTGTVATASVIGISITSATPSSTLTQNTVHTLTNTNATAASVVTGIQFNGATANTVARNQIHGLTVATTSAASEVNGIRIAGGTTTYRNNMIAVGNGIANAIGTGPATGGINGILEAGGINNLFHNSIYIGGAPNAGAGPSYAFASGVVTNVRRYRDNVFFNARSNAGATGSNYVLRVGGTAPNPAGLTINNNLYFANGAGAVFGAFNGADVPNLGAWRIAVGQDSGSFEANPQFADPTNATPDLHLHPTNVTPAEGNGADVGVADDFDGQTRSGLTPVDIGADAGNFNGVDLSGPQITFAPFANTSLTTNRTLVATLTDVSGVATGALAPRIYYRKGAGTYFSQACSLGTGTVLSGTWNCTINHADVGGVATSDAISYFVVAQDINGNVASNAAGATATDVNNVTAPPPAPNSYTIVPALVGTISVGTGEAFTSLTNAGGLFEALNNSIATGNVIIELTSDLVAETGTHPLNRLLEKGTGDYTVVIRPAGAARVISGAFNGALIRLVGASRVTIDGSIGGGGSDRSLIIQNTSLTSPSVVLFGSVGTTPITDSALRNTIIINGANTSSAVVISDATTLGSAGFFSNIVIHNNDIRRAFVGVFATGGTVPQGGSNLTYTQNTVNTAGTDAVRTVGLYMQGVNGATVSQNTVGNLVPSNDESDAGIWLATGTTNATVSANTVAGINYSGTGGFGPIGINLTPGVANSGIVVSGNDISNIAGNGNANGSLARGIAVGGAASSDLTIEKNDVQGIVNTSTGTFPAYGLDIAGGNNIVVRNNFVSNVNFNMTGGAAFSTQFGVFGIRVATGTGHRIHNNSVNLSGALPGTAATSLLTAAFGIVATTSTGLDVRDNIFANNITGGTTSIAHVSVFLPAGGTSAMNLTWNNNAYFFGTDAARQGVGQAGTTAGTNFFTTLPALGAYTGTLSPTGNNDNASQASNGAVPFVSATDLHLVAPSALSTAGVPLPGVTTDIDDEPRSTTTPAIGADELVADVSITKDDGVTTATPGGSVTYTITASNPGVVDTIATVTDTFPPSLTCSWTCVGAGGGTCTAAGAGNINDVVGLLAGSSVTYTASCTIAPSASGSLVNTASVAGAAGDPDLANNSATDTDTLVASSDLSITKTDGVTTATPGGSVTYTITASNAGPSNTSATVADTFPASLTCNWTCSGAGGGTCSAGAAGNINDAVNLPSGGSVTYDAACTISPAATGSLTNTATVTGAATDPNPGNNSATDTDTLTPSANLGISKTNGTTTSTPGGSTTYTITTSNAGPSNATAIVADTFPASLTCTWTCVGAGGGTCTAAGAGNINDAVNLPSGGSVTHTATCSISASATGTLVNTATATASGGVTDPAPGDNSATDTDTLTPTANLGITKTNGVTSSTPGGSTTYTITASNAGPSNVSGATVADIYPASLTCSWTCVGAGGGTCTAAGSGNINDVVNLPSGGSATYTASCTISGSATGSLVNTATVTAPGGVTDPTPGNNSATDTDTLGASADLSITKTDGVTSATPGGSVTYTITASNAGPSNATGATVADIYPAALTCTWTCVGAGGGTCTAAGSGNINDVVNLPSGGSVTYTASCTIAGSASGNLVNTATVAAPPGVTDPTPGNNSATDTDTLLQGTLVISGSPVAFGSVAVGDTSAAQTVTLSNTGGASLDVTALDAATTPFARAGGSCSNTLPITIAAGASCTLAYTFTPTAVVTSNQSLTVTANAPGSGTISLSGTGAGQGNLTITPNSVDLGSVQVGDTSGLATITLGNDGDASLQVTALTLATAPFARTNDGSCGNSLPITIAVGASCTITYVFQPTVVGAAGQTFTVGSDGTGETTFELTGNGTPAEDEIFRDGFEQP